MTSITTSDGCETFERDDDYRGGAYGDAIAYVNPHDPEYRVIIERQDWTNQGPWDWDTWLHCFSHKGSDDKPRYHNSVYVWNKSFDGALPNQQVLLGTYTTVRDLDDDDLAEYLPTDGTVIGLHYWPGNYVTVSDSTDPREWDGYFHVTDAHWRALHGEPMPYTAREAHLRRGLKADCEAATAWINGEVYAWALQHREQWTNDRTGATRSEWETVEGCGGYYAVGKTWLADMVIEAFDARPSMDPVEVAA